MSRIPKQIYGLSDFFVFFIALFLSSIAAGQPNHRFAITASVSTAEPGPRAFLVARVDSGEIVKTVTTSDFEFLSDFTGASAVAREASGEWWIVGSDFSRLAGPFRAATPFRAGICSVEVSKDSWKLASQDGTVLTMPPYLRINLLEIYNSDVLMEEDPMIAAKRIDGSWLLLDNTGKPLFGERKFEHARPSHFGFSIVRDGGVDFVIDNKGNEFLRGKKFKLRACSYGLIPFEDPAADGWNLIDTNGWQSIFRSPKHSILMPGQAAIPVQHAANQSGKLQLVDRTGARISDKVFRFVGGFQGGYAPFMNEAGKWGYVTESGEVLIAPMYRLARPPFFGIAVAKTDTHVDFINANGATLLRYDMSLSDSSD